VVLQSLAVRVRPGATAVAGTTEPIRSIPGWYVKCEPAGASAPATSFGTMTQMHEPLLIPKRIQRDLSDLRKRRSNVRPTEGCKTVWGLRANARISWIGLTASVFKTRYAVK
jgi:hypothetical protein